MVNISFTELFSNHILVIFNLFAIWLNADCQSYIGNQPYSEEFLVTYSSNTSKAEYVVVQWHNI